MIPPGLHRFPLLEHVVHGRPAAKAVPEELGRLQRRRIFLITTASVARGSLLSRLIQALGPSLVGLFAGVTAHGPRQCVIDGARAVRAADADILLAVGGGSVIDAAKVMQLCLRHDLDRPEQLSAHVARDRTEPSTRPDDADRWLRTIAVPTTLSAAEFTWFGGAYDSERRVKEAYSNPIMMPQVIVLDPAMTVETPTRLLLATGMKAVDHAAERLASLSANPYNDAVSSLALRLLAAGLRRVCGEPADLEARAELQYGAFLSMCGGWAGATVGLGHALGHALGAHCGVPHGETSCVLLPAVMRWNASSNPDRQRLIAQALDRSDGDAASALASLIANLSLPCRLGDVGVGRAAFSAIAAKAIKDPLTKNNPRPVSSPADIEEVLELAT
jgi:maleylacetate reductase